jgi:hypothetical protein
MFETCLVKADVLTAMGIKVTIFRDVALCNLVDRYQRFGATYCLKVEAASSTATLLGTQSTKLHRVMFHTTVTLFTGVECCT